MPHPSLNTGEEQNLLELCASQREEYIEWSENRFWKHISRRFVRDNYAHISPSEAQLAVEEVQNRAEKKGGRWFGGRSPNDLDHARLAWDDVVMHGDCTGWRTWGLEPKDGSDEEGVEESDGVDESGVESLRHKKRRKYREQEAAKEDVMERALARMVERKYRKELECSSTRSSSSGTADDEDDVRSRKAKKTKPDVIILSHEDEDDDIHNAPIYDTAINAKIDSETIQDNPTPSTPSTQPNILSNNVPQKRKFGKKAELRTFHETSRWSTEHGREQTAQSELKTEMAMLRNELAATRSELIISRNKVTTTHNELIASRNEIVMRLQSIETKAADDRTELEERIKMLSDTVDALLQ